MFRSHAFQGVSNAVSRNVALLSSPLPKGGLRGVLQAEKNLPQPLLAKEGSRKRRYLSAKGTKNVPE